MRGLFLVLAVLMFVLVSISTASIIPGQSTRAAPSIVAAVIVPAVLALETLEVNSTVFSEPTLTLRAQPNSGDVRSGGGNAADMVSLAVTCKQRFRPLGDDSAVTSTTDDNVNRIWCKTPYTNFAGVEYHQRI